LRLWRILSRRRSTSSRTFKLNLIIIALAILTSLANKLPKQIDRVKTITISSKHRTRTIQI
jgi:hypothetical protein